jgi:hypothetical protein
MCRREGEKRKEMQLKMPPVERLDISGRASTQYFEEEREEYN